MGWVFPLVIVLAVSGCDPEPARLNVRLTAPADKSAQDGPAVHPSVLRVGVASVLSPPQALRRYGEMIDMLGEKLGVRTETVRRRNYSEINDLMRSRYCMVALVCNYAFVRARKEFGAELLAAPQIDGKTTYSAYIIVGRDSPVRSVLDLAGKRFAYADPICNAGWLYPSYRIRQLGRSSHSFFGAETFTYDYQSSIRAVGEGLFDAAGVESPLYEWMVRQKDPAALNTRVLDRSPPFGNSPVVVHPALDRVLSARIRDFLLTLHDTERGRRILTGMMVDRFVEPDPLLYESVAGMAESLERP